MKKHKKELIFGAWIAILVVLTLAVNKLSEIPPPPVPKPPKIDPAVLTARWKSIMDHTVSPPKGDPKAPYTVVEFGDFCCPQCGMMHSVFASLPSNAPVNLYFVNRPFPKLKGHEHAVVAAEAAYAAADKGKFWQMFDVLYDNQRELAPSNFEDYFDQAGLDGAALSKDVQNGKYLAKVQDSYKFCDSIGMTMTPAIVLRDNKTGQMRMAAGRDQINALLATAPWAKNPSGPQAVAKGQ